MELPFPGMDPYLEEPSMWPDVHHRIITAICDQLQGLVVPRYRAVITPYIALESLEINPVRAVVPDVAVVESGWSALAAESAVAVIAAPLTLPVIMDVEVEYARVELRTVRDNLLVAAIELLSPANKRPGADGADTYDKKRRELLRSSAHLIEIDLLRAGRRIATSRPLPAAAYFLFRSQARSRRDQEVWPLALNAPIPPIAVPLRHPDPAVPLDLGRVLREVYGRARYDLAIDYTQPPPAPDLTAEERVWLDGNLRERGLR